MEFNRKLFVFIFIQIQMMGLVFVPSSFAKALVLLTLFLTVVKGYRKGCLFIKPFVFLFLFCLVNMFSCYLLRGQTPIQFLIGKEFTNMLPILSFFSIASFKLSDEKVEKTLIVLSSFFVCCYLLQYLVYPISIFVNANENAVAANARPRIPGQALLSIAFFYYLGKICDKWKWKYVIILLMALLCLLIMGFRSQLGVLFGVAGLFVIKRNRLTGKLLLYAVVGFAGLIALSQVSVAQNKINQMIERGQRDNFNNEDYVRILSYRYFTINAPNNKFEKYMGIGLPNPNSKYGQKIQELKDRHIIWADWGLIGLAWVLGIPGTLCIVWYAMKAFLLKVDKRYYYLKYWFLFIVFASFLTREIYRDGAFAVQGLVLYLISKAHVQYMLNNPQTKKKYGL